MSGKQPHKRTRSAKGAAFDEMKAMSAKLPKRKEIKVDKGKAKVSRRIVFNEEDNAQVTEDSAMRDGINLDVKTDLN